MEFTLSEEQSADVLHQLSVHEELVYLMKKTAISICQNYYDQYVASLQPTFFKKSPLSREQFIKRLTSGEHIIAQWDGSNFCFSGPAFNFKRKAFDAYGITWTSDELNFLITAGVTYMFVDVLYSGKFMKVLELRDLIQKYGSVPYKMNTDELKIYEEVSTRNNYMREALEIMGIEHDL